jgi:Tol biopolymer transport system component
VVWSPDGRRLAYGSSWASETSIWLVRIEDGSARS